MFARLWWHIVSLFVVIFLSIFGVYIFYNGFFLQRVELPLKSECDANTENEPGTPFFRCYSNVQPKFQRAIILIVDALKYEFLRYNEQLGFHETRPFQNKVPIIRQLLRNEPEKAVLFRFIADPPTTTMQRLKGLTTGSLPTFSDLSQNFAAAAIMEDNLISKFRELRKNITFIGDDTWIGLFPNAFNRIYPFSSFDVKDLDTVDHGVQLHLIPEVKALGWDLLIAHTLGVDHCGHRYGPSHPEMARKLTEVNSMIKNIVQEMSEDTVLFVMGDHGMTREGDHGGDSLGEVEAGLFVYSPKSFINQHRIMDKVAQVDFVPTFSLLLGHPIPFSNLGQVISSLFSPFSDQPGVHSTLYRALEINGNQVMRFLREYRKVSHDISAQAFANLESLFEYAQRNHTIEHWTTFLRQSLTDCQRIWAKFDFQKMTVGLVFVGCSVLCLLVMLLVPVGLSWTREFATVLAVAVSIFHFLSMFSNSFQVHEDFVVMCVLLALLWANFLRTCQRTRPSLSLVSALIALSIFIRSMELFRRCREEQWECSVGFFGTGFKDVSDDFYLHYFRVTFALILPIAIFMWVTSSVWCFIDRPGWSNRSLKSLLMVGLLLLIIRLLINSSGVDNPVACSVLVIYGCMISVFVHLLISPIFISDGQKKVPRSVNAIFHTVKRLLDHPDDEADYEGLEMFFNFSSSLFALPVIVILSIVLTEVWAFVVVGLFLLTYRVLVYSKPCSPVISITIWAFLAWHLFFSTGHQTAFSTLHWILPEVGLQADSSFVFRGLIMVIETFPGHVLMSVTLPMLVIKTECFSNDVCWLKDPNLFCRELWRGVLGYLAWNCAKVFIVMFNAAVNRRHLMVWKIFAPRFIFEGVSFIVSSLCLSIAYIFSIRVFSAASKYVKEHQVPLDIYYYQARRTKEFDVRSSRKKR